jgi:vacuolar protein sorting-associated protein 8
VFRWTQLRALEPHLFTRSSNKAQAVLGAPVTGAPTVMAANGFICIGTQSGRVLVFDFKQTLRCICGDSAAGEQRFFPFALKYLIRIGGLQKRRSAR